MAARNYPRPPDSEMIVCKTCGESKPATEYATSKTQPRGIRIHCKACYGKKRKPRQAERPRKPRGTMKPEPVKLPGRKSGYACKIFVGGQHVATVMDPEGCSSREAALAAASRWEREWMDQLVHRNVSN